MKLNNIGRKEICEYIEAKLVLKMFCGKDKGSIKFSRVLQQTM